MLRLSVYLALIDGAEERNLFEQIYWEYEGLMLHRAKEILQDDMQAEDAVHAAFLQIARNMATVGQVLPARRKALVMRILENAAIDSYRKQKRERSHVAPMTEAEDLEQPERTIGAESPLAGLYRKQSGKIIEPRQEKTVAIITGGGAGMNFHKKISEKELRQAAIQAEAYLQAQLPAPESCTDHGSAQLEQRLQQLLAQVQRGEIMPAPLRMGWQYYTRNSAAAVLLCFLLACITMPEAVMAGCQTVIQAVKSVLVEYTEFHYTSTAPADTKFVPLQFGYLPEGLDEIEREENEDSLRIVYADELGNRQFILRQELLTEDMNSTHIVDTEDTQVEIVVLQGEEVTFIYKEERIQFVWMHDSYMITGQTRLEEKEVIKILQSTRFQQIPFQKSPVIQHGVAGDFL